MGLPTKPVNPSAGEVPNDTIEELEAIINAITPTEWVKPESLGAKVEENAAKLDGIRLESNQSVARLRGALKVKAGESLTAGETLCTLPVGYRPAHAQQIDCVDGTATGIKLLIATTGVVTLGSNVAEAVEVFLDGQTFPIN